MAKGDGLGVHIGVVEAHPAILLGLQVKPARRGIVGYIPVMCLRAGHGGRKIRAQGTGVKANKVPQLLCVRQAAI